MATRGTINTNIRVELQETTAGFWSETELHNWENEAHADLVAATRQEATATATLVIGTESYTLPVDFYMVRRVEIQSTAGSTQSWVVVLAYNLDLRDPGDPMQNQATTACPSGYYIFNNRIYFVPAPDAAYSATIYYYKNATAFTSDSDTPSYPEGIPAERFDRLILLYTCGMALRKRQDSAYTTYLADYAAAKAQLVGDALNRGASAPLLVSNDWANDS